MPRKSNKREKLLDAAAEAFWVNGYGSTSLADIATSSDVPLGNIYYYFKTKAAIAEGVSEIFVAETRQSLEEINQKHKSPVDRLIAFIDLLRESAESRAKLGCPLASGIRDFSDCVPTALSRTNEVFDTLVGWLSQVLEDAQDKKAKQHARAIITRWQGSIVLSHGSGSEQFLTEALDDLEQDIIAWTEQRANA
ncbi:MAG: TetR/AcrR family transcriptional regulator [Hyphomicrobiales bacterium]